MFLGKGKPGYIVNEVLTTLTSFMTDISLPNKFDDQTKHIFGLEGNLLPGKIMRYYNPTYVWPIKEIGDTELDFLKNSYNNRIPILFVPHVDTPLINFFVYVKNIERVDIGNRVYQNCVMVEFYSKTPINKIVTTDDIQIFKKNYVIFTP